MRKNNITKLLSSLQKHTSEYLRDKANIAHVECAASLQELQSLALHDLTAIISVAEGINMILAFSYETPLLKRIATTFLYEEGEDEASEDDCLDMASEFINIIVGLCVTSINSDPLKPILFSPPLVIHEAKIIRQRKTSQLYAISLKTKYGKLDINCIGPRELFDDQLNYLGEN